MTGKFQCQLKEGLKNNTKTLPQTLKNKDSVLFIILYSPVNLVSLISQQNSQ